MKHRLVIEFETPNGGEKPNRGDEMLVAQIVADAEQAVHNSLGKPTLVRSAHYFASEEYKLWAEPPRRKGQLQAEEEHERHGLDD